MKDWSNNWSNLTFALVPVVIALIAGYVLTVEYLQPDTQKAIRMVRESSPRKENFTVQQYLYSTIYFRRDQGEDIEIRGWRAEPAAAPSAPINVEFSYADADGPAVARWSVDLEQKKVTPLDELARDLSWH